MRPAAPETVRDAVQGGDMSRLRELLDRDPELAQATLADGMSILQYAVYQRRHEAVRLLCERGALVSVHEAAALGDVEALERLLDAAPDELGIPGPDGFTPLHLAAHFAQHDALQVLLERGADLHAKSTNPAENTPLHAAASGAAVATLRILLASGADPDARDAGQNTPLHVAAATGAVPCVQALLEGGADPAARNDRGETAVELARQRGQLEAATILGQAAEA